MRPLTTEERTLITRVADRLDQSERDQLRADADNATAVPATPDGSRIRFEILGYQRPPYRGQHPFGVEGKMLDRDGTELSVLFTRMRMVVFWSWSSFAGVPGSLSIQIGAPSSYCRALSQSGVGIVYAQAGPGPEGGPPPVSVPGNPENEWKWNTNPQNSRGGSWGPRKPIPGQSQPSGSWGPEGHWDVDDGLGGRQRYRPDGTPISPEEGHRGRRPGHSEFAPPPPNWWVPLLPLLPLITPWPDPY